MKEIKCICGVIVPQTPGKKQRIYCTPKCKQKDWQDKRRQAFSALLGKPSEPSKVKSPNIPVKDDKKEVTKSSIPSIDKEGILNQIALIRSEKIPEQRNKSLLGQKSWKMEQSKRIKELENLLK